MQGGLASQGDDFGLTPLMLAALNGHHDCMLALLERRAQVDAHPPIRQKGVLAKEHKKKTRLVFSVVCNPFYQLSNKKEGVQ